MKGECKQTTSVATELDSAISSVTGAMTDYSVSNLTKIWVAGLALAISPVIAWFAFRWLKKVINKALFKGRL